MTSPDALPSDLPDTVEASSAGRAADVTVLPHHGRLRGRHQGRRASAAKATTAEILLVYEAVHDLLDGETGLGRSVNITLVEALTGLPAGTVRRVLDILTARAVLHVGYHREPRPDAEPPAPTREVPHRTTNPAWA